MAPIDWNHRQNDLDDVKAAQDQIKKDTEQYQTLKGSIASQHKSELAGAQTPEDRQAADDKANKLNTRADSEFKQTDKQNHDNLHRMEDKLSANQNLAPVDPNKPQGESQPYEKHPDVGVPQFGGPATPPANDNEPGKGPGGPGGQTSAQPDPGRDFSAPPPPPPPPPPDPDVNKSQSEEQGRSR